MHDIFLVSIDGGVYVDVTVDVASEEKYSKLSDDQ